MMNKRRWKGLNIDLSLLADRIALFLSSKKFQAIKSKSDRGFTIIGRSSLGSVLVILTGTPNDFEVELTATGKPSDVYLGILTSFIGGGSLLLRRLRSEEAVERIKNDFWGFIENELHSWSICNRNLTKNV